MLKRIAVYGLALAAGALALQWLEYDRLALAHPAAIYFGLFAAGFLGLGVFVGARVFARAPAPPGNPAARDALGLSARELDVLRVLASGCSNKEIANRLKLSPNTVKTHVAHLYEKLGARRRTEAVARARELAILP